MLEAQHCPSQNGLHRFVSILLRSLLQPRPARRKIQTYWLTDHPGFIIKY